MIKDEKFQKYLSDSTGISINIIKSLVDRGLDEFQVAAVLIGEQGIKKEDLGRIWGSYLGYTYVDPMDSITNLRYIKKAGLNYILRNKVLPLYKLGKAVTVAMSEPQNPFLQAKIEERLDELISVVFCFPFDIENYILTNEIKRKLNEE